MNIGRNDLCPCGSGEKYKKCCEINIHPAGYGADEIAILKLNKWIAYKGKVGRERDAFCIEYIKNKQTVLEAIKEKQLEGAQSKAETITCRPGCTYCCYHYVTTTLDETEAIVYHLYQNIKSLNSFLEAYRRWRAIIDGNSSLITGISRAYNASVHDACSTEKQEHFHSLAKQYQGLNLPCPFLSEDMCLIYPVRPWACAGFCAVTPPDWCRPDSPNKSRTMSISQYKDMRKIAHYRNSRGNWMTMPKAVYSILQGGIYTLAKIPGMESLERETMEDPEVNQLLERLRKG
jgi:Fe-S-cluster containining protein